MERLAVLLFVALFLLSCNKSNDVIHDLDNNIIDPPQETTKVVLGDYSVKLSNYQCELIEHIDESQTLTCNKKILERGFPKVGQIIVIDENNNFPYGFVGKINAIEEINDKIVVKTDIPLFTEAFKEFYIKDSISPSSMEQTRFKANMDQDGFVWMEKPLDVKLGVNRIEGALKIGMKPIILLSIGNGQSLFTATNRVKLIINLSPSIVVENSGEPFKFQLDKIPIGRTPSIPYVGPININGIINLIFEPKAEFTLSGDMTFQYEFIVGTECRNGVWAYSPPRQVPVQTWAFTPAAISLKGEAFLGTGLDIQFSPMNILYAQMLKVYFGNRIGFVTEGEIELIGNDPIKIYEENKDASVDFNFIIDSDIKAECGLITKREASFPLVKWIDIDLGKRYLFPDFLEINVDKNIDNNSIDIQSRVNRDLLLESKIGWALFSTNEDYVLSSSAQYHLNQNFTNPFVKRFEQLNKDIKYRAVPYVSFANLSFIVTDDIQEVSFLSPTIVGVWEGFIGYSCKYSTHKMESGSIVFRDDGTGSFTSKGDTEDDGGMITRGFIYNVDYENKKISIDNGVGTFFISQLDDMNLVLREICESCGKSVSMKLHR